MHDSALPPGRSAQVGSLGASDGEAFPLEESIRRTYRHIELAVREGTILIGHDGRVVDSFKVEQRLGIESGSLVGGHPLPDGWTMSDDECESIPRDEHPAVVACRTGKRVERVLTYEAPDPNGLRHRFRFVALPVSGDPDVAVDLVVTDYDRRRDSRRRLESQDTRFRTMTDMLAVAVWEATTSGEVTYVNPKYEELTGLGLAQTPDLPMFNLVHPDDLVSVMEAANDAVTAGAFQAHYRLLHVDGSSRWVSSRMSVLRNDDGDITGFVGVIEDIDELRRSEQRTQRLGEIVEAAADAVLVFENRRLTYVNRSAATLLGRLDPAFTTDLESYEYSSRLLDRLASIEALLVEEGTWSGDTEFTDLDGVRVDLALTVSTTVDDGEWRHVVMAHDIRERKIREAELTHNAAHDPLTGLANRHRLAEVIAETADDQRVGLLFVDLDHFKRVNDVHGHAAGDRVLEVTARRVVSVVAPEYLVARVGGDEMVVWAPEVSELDELAEQIVTAIAADPVHLDGVTYAVSVTVGGAIGRAVDHSDLMRRADAALYAAKRNGRSCWKIDHPPA
ncbi:sensor domain-containing protein [Ilumatobacter nonamiensis]|uniref:sensor domain-containing protein n=1 Tax=Ilumatobacter nonamiensis TaxID=467093 RepID=UPI0011D1A23C|nr:sensor domain-containing diguanylate cyclase [Ilumatobacter nonamiensis]